MMRFFWYHFKKISGYDSIAMPRQIYAFQEFLKFFRKLNLQFDFLQKKVLKTIRQKFSSHPRFSYHSYNSKNKNLAEKKSILLVMFNVRKKSKKMNMKMLKFRNEKYTEWVKIFLETAEYLKKNEKKKKNRNWIKECSWRILIHLFWFCHENEDGKKIQFLYFSCFWYWKIIFFLFENENLKNILRKFLSFFSG